MSIIVMNGDLLDAPERVICHQVNCQGRMRSGVAAAIRQKWPEVYESYLDYIELMKTRYNFDNDGLLGLVDFVPVGNGDDIKTICNMFAQEDYGYDKQMYTSYDAFWRCLYRINSVIMPGEPIAMPYKIGCGLGGANWEVIQTMIKEVLGDNRDVILYRLDV